MTVAAFMDLALYDPAVGYYARAAQTIGPRGRFFYQRRRRPAVRRAAGDADCRDGGLLDSRQPAAGSRPGRSRRRQRPPVGRHPAARCASRTPDLFDRLRLHLVEASPAARAAQPATLGDLADRLAVSSPAAPRSFEGVLVANELLDALPVHQVVMREDGLRETYVVASRESTVNRRESTTEGTLSNDDCRLSTIEGAPSTPALAAYLAALGIALEPGWRAEINLRAIEWIRDAARRLRRGFIILIDYGHEARDLYSASHAAGTLTSFAAHQMRGPESTAAARRGSGACGCRVRASRTSRRTSTSPASGPRPKKQG